MSIKMIEFIYSDDVTVINKAQFEAHMRLYGGYIKKVNEIEAKLESDSGRKDANATYSQFRCLKRGETYSLNGVILHELYFENIGGETKDPNDQLSTILENNFGSFEQWKEDFIATAKASRGWVTLAYEQRTKQFMNISLDAHDVGNIVLSFPVLVLDVYEHAYFLEYADNKDEYINNFMKNINWDIVSCRLNRIRP